MPEGPVCQKLPDLAPAVHTAAGAILPEAVAGAAVAEAVADSVAAEAETAEAAAAAGD